MQNVRTYTHHLFPLPPDASTPLLQSTLSNDRLLYTTTPNALHSLSLSSNTSQTITLPCTPNALAPLPPHLLLSSRSGQLVTLHPQTHQLNIVADVSDEIPARSGVLAMAASPDASICAVISPVNTLLLDANIELLAEIPHPAIAQHAAVSWRGDGEAFVVVLSVDRRCVGYVLDRQGGAQKMLQLDVQLEGTLCAAWEPRIGGMIYVTCGDGHMYVFERNGLRHLRSEFQVTHVRGIAWSLDCAMMAVWHEHSVSVFKRRNYKWYCAKVYRLQNVRGVCWDEDENWLVAVGEDGFRVRIVESVNIAGSWAAVVDGKNVYVTDFGRGIVPPPLFHARIEFEDYVDAVLDAKEEMVVLRGEKVECVKGQIEGTVGKELKGERQIWEVGEQWIGGVKNGDVLFLHDGERVVLFQKEIETARVELGGVRCMGRTSSGVVVVNGKGDVVEIDVNGLEGEKLEGAGGMAVEVKEVGEGVIVVRELEGELRGLDWAGNKVALSVECTSFAVCENFLVYTTFSNVMYCVGISGVAERCFEQRNVPSLKDMLQEGNEILKEGLGATRPIDRGSLIVFAGETVVLQAPRGNLESVLPRPVVWERVAREVKDGGYGKAFRICRRERVDMNHIVDVDHEGFMKNVATFVEEVGSGLSVFIMGLKGEKVEEVCEAIANVEGDVNGVLCALVRLGRIDEAVDKVRGGGEGGLEYLKVLVKDERKVYECALGLYDLKFALEVARGSTLDPAEYSAELKNLKGMEEMRRRYVIDMKLERFGKALKWLYECGEAEYDECVKMCHEHKLYEVGLTLFREGERRTELLGGYGGHLKDTRRFADAAGVYISIGNWEGAVESYREGGMWEAAVGAAWRCKIDEEERESMLQGIADDLVESGNVLGAARVKCGQLEDVEEAIEILCGGGEWMAACEAIASHCARRGNGEELWEKLDNLVVQGSESVMGMIRENRAKIRERGQRLQIVRDMKRALEEKVGRDEADSDVFSTSTASSIGSRLSDVTFASRSSAATSVYTTAESAMTGPLTRGKLEKQAERRKRKEGRKRIREGHPREEEALVAYLRKLIPGEVFAKKVRDVGRALLFVGRAEVVRQVVGEMEQFVKEAEQLPQDVKDGVQLCSNEWAQPGACVEFL